MPDRRETHSGGREGRLAAIKAHITEHLRQRSLSVAVVAARQGVTPRYVQMLFEAEGTTFSQYVVGERLALAHRLLVDRRTSVWTIRAIAIDAGFADISYFNRAFRRHYGASPSRVREAARPSMAPRPARREAGGSKPPSASF
jgi:AraC-like DNA-binding protein